MISTDLNSGINKQGYGLPSSSKSTLSLPFLPLLYSDQINYQDQSSLRYGALIITEIQQHAEPHNPTIQFRSLLNRVSPAATTIHTYASHLHGDRPSDRFLVELVGKARSPLVFSKVSNAQRILLSLVTTIISSTPLTSWIICQYGHGENIQASSAPSLSSSPPKHLFLYLRR